MKSPHNARGIITVYVKWKNKMKMWKDEELLGLFERAEKFLIDKLKNSKLDLDEQEILDEELLVYVDGSKRPNGISGENSLFYKMLVSLSNRQGFNNFIGKDTLKKSKSILFEYNAVNTYNEYKDKKDLLIKRIREISGKELRVGKRHIGSQYADGIISIAKFLSRFKSLEEFDKFVESFSKNDVAALPALLAMEIKGYGFALACDALKESGYKQYGKPDVHIKEIFAGINLIEEKDDLETFRMIQRIAQASKTIRIKNKYQIEPAVVDKVFWIIGSGKYNEYNDKHKDKEIIEANRQRDEFINEERR